MTMDRMDKKYMKIIRCDVIFLKKIKLDLRYIYIQYTSWEFVG